MKNVCFGYIRTIYFTFFTRGRLPVQPPRRDFDVVIKSAISAAFLAAQKLSNNYPNIGKKHETHVQITTQQDAR